MSLKIIQQPILEELEKFEKQFRALMESNVALLDKIMHYIIQRKGKQLRPTFSFLSAKICGETTDATYVAASMVELLHTASLVHDDVVDDSYQRREFFSINAIWKNKIAVLVGDYLFAQGLLVALNNNQFQMLKILSNAVQEMIEGELLQIEKARKLDIKEDIYFNIIKQKTASLIAAACSAGAASVTKDQSLIDRMKRFGEYVGIAYQIKDDIMDYGTSDIGKPTQIDIQEKKMTLPLIFTLQNVDKSEKRKLVNTVRKHNKNKKKVSELIARVNEVGGIQYAEKKMVEYQEKAIAELSIFENGDRKKAMEALVYYTTARKK